MFYLLRHKRCFHCRRMCTAWCFPCTLHTWCVDSERIVCVQTTMGLWSTHAARRTRSHRAHKQFLQAERDEVVTALYRVMYVSLSSSLSLTLDPRLTMTWQVLVCHMTLFTLTKRTCCAQNAIVMLLACCVNKNNNDIPTKHCGPFPVRRLSFSALILHAWFVNGNCVESCPQLHYPCNKFFTCRQNDAYC